MPSETLQNTEQMGDKAAEAGAAGVSMNFNITAETMDLLRQFGAVDAADNVDMTAATDPQALVAALEEQGANPILVLGAQAALTNSKSKAAIKKSR